MEILFRHWIPVVVWSGIIFTFSSIPNLKVPPLGLGFEDKIYHFTEFFIWGILFVKSYKIACGGGTRLNCFALAVVIGAVFALIDEGHQHWIAGRGFDWKDLAANWSGLLTSLLIFK